MADILRLAEQATKQVTKLGASDCDVVVIDSRSIVAELERSSMKQASVVQDPGMGIRAFDRGCSGFSYTTTLDARSIKRAGELAMSQARSGTHDPDFKGLPPKKRPASVPGLYDRKLAGLEPDEVVEMAISLCDIAKHDNRVASVNAGVSVGSCVVALANSNGFSATQKLTSFDSMAEVVARSGTRMFSGVDMFTSRKLNEGALRTVGGNALESAVRGLDQSSVTTGSLPIVIDSLALGFILSGALGSGANAEAVQRKRSYLAGKLGNRIGSEKFSVWDDSTLEWGPGSAQFDGEGTTAKRTDIIKKGVLKSFMHDSYSAGKDGVESTGNSVRGGGMWSFRRPPSISSTNLVVAKGDSSLEEMFRETRQGVYLKLTYDSANIATGEFSGLMMESFMIDKGELGPCITQATLGIDMIDLYSRIDMVGKTARDAFGVRAPPVRISSGRVAGSG